MSPLETLIDWMLGRLSPEARVWTALGPALLAAAYFIIGFVIYNVRFLFRGAHEDEEMRARGDNVLTGMYLRLYFVWIMQPLWKLILSTGIPANAVTTLSVLLAAASGVAAGVGRFALAGWLYILAGICDFLDGRVARVRGSASKSGAALDSVLDRYADAAVLVGLSWYYRDSWVLLATQAALVGSSIVPYIRARGEAAGVVVKDVGLMQRADRILYLGAAVAVSPVVEVWLDPHATHPLHRLAIMGVVLLAVSTQVTALQRLMHLLGALDETLAARVWRSGRGSLFRLVAAAVVATLADFALVNAFVAGGHMSAPIATAFSCLIGALVNFSINRVWTFGSTDAKLPQMSRYGFVSLTGALLNAGGVAVLLMIPALDYRIAWALVRGAVFVAWNFPLQTSYVFGKRDMRPA